jgi:hypothetical protein
MPMIREVEIPRKASYTPPVLERREELEQVCEGGPPPIVLSNGTIIYPTP